MKLTLDCTPQNVEAISTIAALLNGQEVDKEAVERAVSLLKSKPTFNVAFRENLSQTPVSNVFPVRIANTLMRNNINFVEEIDVDALASFHSLGEKSIQLIKDFLEKGVVPKLDNSSTSESKSTWVSLYDRYTNDEVELIDRQIFDCYLDRERSEFPRLKLHIMPPELLDFLCLATQTRKQPERLQAFVKSCLLEKNSFAKSAELIGVSGSHARVKLTKFERQSHYYARQLINKFEG